MKVIRLFAKSFQFLGEARGRYLLGVALGACELALLFATPTINQMLIDIVTGERQGNVVYTLLGMLAVFLLLVPPVVAGRYFQATAAAQGSAHLRKKLFRHILAMPVEEQSKFKAGDFLTRLSSSGLWWCSPPPWRCCWSTTGASPWQGWPMAASTWPSPCG